jgi:hypothetical protein
VWTPTTAEQDHTPQKPYRAMSLSKKK